MADKILDVEKISTTQELKRAYRTASHIYHPDKGGSEELFKQLQEEYEDLLKKVKDDSGSKLEEQVTVEGFKLSDLGKGLGPTTNGRECKKCHGQGYYSNPEMRYESTFKCPTCNGEGCIPSKFPCRECQGTGQFKLRSGRIVECRKCKGSGSFTHPTHRKTCPSCHGFFSMFGREIPTGRKIHYVCGHCRGVGEEELLNPVLQKGALV